MDEQPHHPPPHRLHAAVSRPRPRPQRRNDPTPDAVSLSASVPTLRFPRPEGSQRLANWVSSSSPNIDIMKAPSVSDADSLADSTYSIIASLDGASQAGSPPNSHSGASA